jgi:hypothetical protein
VTIVDALLPDLDDRAAVESWSPATPEEVAERLTGLVKAVGYAMQPQVHPRLRPEAEHYLSTRLDAHIWRYFQRRRLTSLMLPGAVPPQLAALPRSAAVRRVARRARALQRRLVRKTAPE